MTDTLKINIKKIMIINFGLLILALGLYFFTVPHNIAAGGVLGLALILHELIPQVPISVFLAGLNVFLLFLGIVLIGKEFAGYTLYASLMFNVIYAALERFVPMSGPLTDDILISLIYGILIQGIGIGIVFKQGASTGGTDITAKIINKYTSLELGKSLMICDFIVTTLAILVFGINKGMYALLGVVMNSLVIDKVIAGFSTKFSVFIISSKIDEINKFINVDLYRGTTIYEATGGYSKNPKPVLQTIVSKKQYIRLKNYVKQIDPAAFLAVSYVTEVEGEGFTFEPRIKQSLSQ